jgi:hypothetical protein
MSRVRALTAALAVVSLVALALGATRAQAARVPVTGGTTTITPTAEAVQTLTSAGISASPIEPATAPNGVFTFPIARGLVNPANLRGFILHKGGVKFTKGARSFSLRRPLIVSRAQGATLNARVSPRACHIALVRTRGHRHARRLARRACRHHFRYVAVARLVDRQRAPDGTSVTATVKLTALTARLINRLAGQRIAMPGVALGTATIAPTTS